MKLDRVTITGADDSVRPEQLAALSKRFPFVEWGILSSASQTGHPRFPTLDWLTALWHVQQQEQMQLSLHLCGRWLRSLLQGVKPPMNAQLVDMFKRMQLNFHGESQTVGDGFEEALLELGVPEYIFQIDGAMGQEIIAHVEGNGGQAFRCVPLFDTSHGAGKLAGHWPAPFDLDTYHGYAGGLGPHNLEEQIPLIAQAANGARFWIDMETRVRTQDAGGDRFDLEKVERCLTIAERFVRLNGVTEDCASMRQAAAAAPYTIAQAIADAQWVRRSADGYLEPGKAKRCIDTLLSALERSRCYFNAVQRGQEVFVLVQQDRAAPAAIVAWADEAEKHGCTSDKVADAYAQSGRWLDQPDTATKWPD